MSMQKQVEEETVYVREKTPTESVAKFHESEACGGSHLTEASLEDAVEDGMPCCRCVDPDKMRALGYDDAATVIETIHQE